MIKVTIPVRQPLKAMNAETVDNAGIETIVMLVTASTNDLVSPEVLRRAPEAKEATSSKPQAATT